MGQRHVKRTKRKPSFFWQGVLILAPVLVLAKLGALALNQDRRMARHEAELRASEIAEQAADEIAAALRSIESPLLPVSPGSPVVVLNTNVSVKFLDRPSPLLQMEIDDAGELLWPKFFARVPNPQPLALSVLSESQRVAWHSLQTATGKDAYEAFIATQPPTNFAIDAGFLYGEKLLRSGSSNELLEAAQHFQRLSKLFYDDVTESGLPARPLALFKEFQARSASWKSLLVSEEAMLEIYRETLRTITKHPSAITSELLDRLATIELGRTLTQKGRELRDMWTTEARHNWSEQELLRNIYGAAKAQLRPEAVSLSSMARQELGWRLRSEPPMTFWVSLRAGEAFKTLTARSTARHAIEREYREPDPPALTPAWSNAMLEEARDRVARRLSNFSQSHFTQLTFDESWFLVRLTNTSGSTLLCRRPLAVTDLVSAALKRIRKPEFLDFSVRVAGMEIIATNQLELLENVAAGKGSGQLWRKNQGIHPPAIATATRLHGAQPSLVSVGVHLVSPDLLYARQEQRAILFKLLVGASALASVIGFVSAWRAFRKQLGLAEMQSNFVSSVSHELRAPIASVRLMAEGLERGKISEPAKQHEYFRFITQECRRLSAMIENVLDFARIEQGRKEYEFEPTNVAALMQQTVKLMEPYAAEREVQLVTHMAAPESQSLTAEVDGAAIQQALVNLIDNAIKHSPNGTAVEVRLDLPDSPTMLRLSVRDVGLGIPASEHEKIFERFYRLGSELRRETPGVGIGLSIVKHIVEAHGGRVRVESEVGKGSCFTIELPLTAEAQRRGEEA